MTEVPVCCCLESCSVPRTIVMVDYQARLIVNKNKFLPNALPLIQTDYALTELLPQIKLSARRQKGLTGYCFKYIDRPFCLQTDEALCSLSAFS